MYFDLAFVGAVTFAAEIDNAEPLRTCKVYSASCVCLWARVSALFRTEILVVRAQTERYAHTRTRIT